MGGYVDARENGQNRTVPSSISKYPLLANHAAFSAASVPLVRDLASIHSTSVSSELACCHVQPGEACFTPPSSLPPPSFLNPLVVDSSISSARAARPWQAGGEAVSPQLPGVVRGRAPTGLKPPNCALHTTSRVLTAIICR
jgi:hypothetical protein